MRQFPLQGGTWHHPLMLKVTSCGRKCAGNKPEPGSAHGRRRIMTSPGHTDISLRDIQTSAPKLCASGCRVPSVTARNAPNRLYPHCYTCLSWDHKRLTITGISDCVCQCFFSFKMNTNPYVFNFPNDPVFTISHAQCSMKIRKVVSLIELHQFLTPLAMRLSYYIVKSSWYRYFAVNKGG